MHTLHRKGGWLWDGTYFKNHPEWYGVALKQDKETGEWVPGDRDHSILCPTHPEMRQQLVKEVDEWLAANYPIRKSVSLSPEDTWQYCHCERCIQLVDSDDARTASVLYIDLLNYVAKALHAKYPKAHFNLLSYGAAFTAPQDVTRFRMAPGTGVAFAHHWRNHGIPIDGNERFLPRFLAWRELCDRFLFWDYYNNFHCTENPFPNTDIFGPAFKFYRDNKFDGGFCQMPFARLAYGWGKGEPQSMSPNWCEAGFTVGSNRYEGVWYVFSNVRVSTTVTNDPAAAYTGIYAPWYIGNQRAKGGKAEICSMRIERTVGDHAWRLACLGKWGLRPDTRVWVMPGVVNETHDLAVRNITLVAPDIIEKDITLGSGIGSRRFGAASALCTGAVSWQRDAIDRYDYCEIDCLSTNQPSAIVAPFPGKSVRDFAAGDRYVFARVRVLASTVLVGDAARIQLVVPGLKGAPDRIVDEIAVSASRGDEAWQLVCLGRETLDPGMVLRAVASNDATTSVAVRDFILVSPEFLETEVKVQ